MDLSYHQNNPSEDNNNDRSKKNHSKKGKGRQKIPMEKIKSETNRQVTFSKRRLGLFKKASELHTLCGAENAVVVFSPSDKAHSFSAPNIQTITDRFLNQTTLGETSFNRMSPAHGNLITQQRNVELTNLERQLKDEMRKKKEHDRIRKANPNQIGCPSNLDLLDFDQLQAMKDNIMSLKHALTTQLTDAKRDDINSGSGGLGVGYPMDPNIQSLFGNNETMLNNMGSAGALNDCQAMFEVGGSYNQNPNVGFMNDAREGYYNNPSATFFPDMMTNNHGYVDPYDPTVSNIYGHQFPPCPNGHEASSSSLGFPYNYGSPNAEVPNENVTVDADGEGKSMNGGAFEYLQDEYGGFNNDDNFGHGN